jgi:hypothetical protein
MNLVWTDLASDNPAYVNQAWLDHTGLTLMPISLRYVTYGVPARAPKGH